MSAPLVIQWRTVVKDDWHTLECSGLPVARPVKIRIDFSPAVKLSGLEALIDKIQRTLSRVHAAVTPKGERPLVAPEAHENLLEVVVSDGSSTFTLDPRIPSALVRGPETWVLPVMPATGSPGSLPGDLPKQNIAFWHDTIEELHLTVLARAGVTSLDRRVFISYRRIESEPLAGQLFDALNDRNFWPFLDTVSVQPGVDFQSSLFEQLADKSMVVLLHSKTFSQSHWTMEEIKYARAHELSVLILRLPTVPKDDALEAYYRAGDVMNIDAAELEQQVPARMKPDALAALVKVITEQHDVEMINRLALLRKRTLDALEAGGVAHEKSECDSSILAHSSNGQKSYRLFPASRPPGLPELFDASIFTSDPQCRRIVIGHIASFAEMRVKQLDWTVNARNVAYADVSMLDVVAAGINKGSL